MSLTRLGGTKRALCRHSLKINGSFWRAMNYMADRDRHDVQGPRSCRSEGFRRLEQRQIALVLYGKKDDPIGFESAGHISSRLQPWFAYTYTCPSERV